MSLGNETVHKQDSSLTDHTAGQGEVERGRSVCTHGLAGARLPGPPRRRFLSPVSQVAVIVTVVIATTPGLRPPQAALRGGRRGTGRCERTPFSREPSHGGTGEGRPPSRVASIFDVEYEKHFRRQLTPESCPEERTGRPEIRAYAHQRKMTGRPLWAALRPARAAPGCSVLARERNMWAGARAVTVAVAWLRAALA